MRYFCLFLVLATVMCAHKSTGTTHELLTISRAQIDSILSKQCLTVNRCSHEELENTTAEIRKVVYDIAESVKQLGVMHGVVHECIHRYLVHNDSRLVHSNAVPSAVRGLPELDLAWSLLSSVEYNELRCKGSKFTSNHLCHQRVEDLSWHRLADISSGACGRGGRNEKGKEYHSRLINELNLRRADLARWFLAIIGSGDSHETPDSSFLELKVRGSVQLVSIENGRSLGVTTRYCRDRELPVVTSDLVDGTVIVAFGDKTLCKYLLYTAQIAGVRVKLLEYVKSAGHRQMVEKLLVFYKSLPSNRLVVKLDGSDVVLTPQAQYIAFEERWRKLGGGIIFTAEAALFYHIGNNREDCKWVARYPPSPTVYRFLNSGGYMGLAGELVSMLEQALQLTNPFWSTPDDQSVYATWFLQQSATPAIKLDYCQDIFATLSGPPPTAQFSTLTVTAGVGIKHALTGSQPIVAHMPGRAKRFEQFLSYMMPKNAKKS